MSELSDAIEKSIKANPLMGLSPAQRGEGLSAQLASKKKLSSAQLKTSVAKQEKAGKNVNTSDYKPINDFLAHAYNVMETPLSLTGALMLGHERDVQQNRPESLLTGFGGPTMANARRLLSQGKLGELAQRYSTTSLEANKARAEAGDVGAQYFQKHPSQFGLLGFGEEFANPANVIGGRVAGLAGKLAKSGLTAAGKTVARGEGMGARAARAAGEVATGNRFAELRQAAADQAGTRGVNPQQAANQADLAGRALATAPQRARAVAQHVTKSVFKGLTKDEQLEVVDRAEGMKANPFKDPKREALVTQRVTAYKGFRSMLDSLTKQAGYSDPSMLEYNYFPRSGSTLPPGGVAAGKAVSRRGPVGPMLRKDTLELDRAFKTRQQAIFHGRYNPDWDPAATLEQHVQSRMENVGREQAYHRLADLGLVDPTATNPGFVPTEPMGSPTLKNATVHPSIGSLIRDTTPAANPQGTLAHVGHLAARELRNVNRAFAKLQVSNPVYHPLVNVSQNIAAQALQGKVNPLEFAKGLVAKTPGEAIATGADIPFSEGSSVADTLRPFSDLSAKEKLGRVAKTPGRAVNAVTNTLLYKHIQPRMAEATFRGMKGKLGEEGAALKTRQILGEPENLPPSLEGAAQIAMFPHWVTAMLRYWPEVLVKAPALYMAPHTAAQARNTSRGSKLTAYDYSKLIPEIIAGKAKSGNDTTISPPSPADRSLGMIDVIGNAITGNFDPKAASRIGLNLLNPLLSLGARAALTAYARPSDLPSTIRLWDKDAPPQNPLQSLTSLDQTLGKRYSPTRGNLGNPLDTLAGFVGLNSSERMSDDRSKWVYKVDKMLREGYSSGGTFHPGIDEIRNKIAAAHKAGQDYFMWGKQKVPIAVGEKYADAAYAFMQSLEQKAQGTP